MDKIFAAKGSISRKNQVTAATLLTLGIQERGLQITRAPAVGVLPPPVVAP